ncbi:BLUF domain protein [Thioalkalivibrio sp. K90mix]|uniref:BLUF domain-containing protein n=1 Tax=unclassified Thioalkalivibrio TaxID=2621013 RepID=UPI000195A1E0|nr:MULTISPECIES: BLUF domain-containing protein [unclassified Thioalkalivibrio]ADC72402.1 BLUF domain protein [Thioalkalivibrio sp. K90mix]
MTLQLVYVSRAAFAPHAHAAQGIEPEVGRILLQSRQNNPRARIVGALYYGDGHFFQCLEGEPEAVYATLERIRRDPRHEEITVLRERELERPGFGEWSMKYVPAAGEVRALLQQFGQRRFDPFGFDDQQIEAMLDLLRSGRDSELEAAPATSGSTPSTSHAPPGDWRRQLALAGWVAAAVTAGIAGTAGYLFLAGA